LGHVTNAQSFDKTVREVFAPIYPVIAEQIKTKTAISSGKCLDAGCGTGALGIALAKITNLHITFFDQSEEMLTLAEGYASANGFGGRSAFVCGDIHEIDMEDESIDIVISRGSIPFWDDWSKAYGEIVRVLKKGGMAYIGGGFGSAELGKKITKQKKAENPEWQNPFKERMTPERRATLPSIIKSFEPKHFEIIEDDSGFWAVITK
jgi:ubiquinone/menaquinone biosynthesis C-methylase UbiE